MGTSMRERTLSLFDYAALGISTPWPRPDPCKPCGTPYPYSIDEEGQEKGTVVVEMGAKGTITTRCLAARAETRRSNDQGSGRRLRRGCDDFVRIVLTDPAAGAVNVRERLIAKFSKMLRCAAHIRSSGVMFGERRRY